MGMTVLGMQGAVTCPQRQAFVPRAPTVLPHRMTARARSLSIQPPTMNVGPLRANGEADSRTTSQPDSSAKPSSSRESDSQWKPSYERNVPDTYAIVEIGGHQLIVEPGRWYEVNRLKAPPGSMIRLGRVLALKNHDDIRFGRPYLYDVGVVAHVLEDTLGKKIRVLKFKRKKHYKKIRGHRQHLTRFLITKIFTGAEPLMGPGMTEMPPLEVRELLGPPLDPDSC